MAMVNSIHGLAESGDISKSESVVVILIPLGAVAETVSVALKDKLTLIMGITVAASVAYHLAWMRGKPLPLLFDSY
ncbi:hypothetical protein PM082_016263 [Marasmius tenuissimus]|nr:hypothetical protein PM082_016263 [Marasmius tenuissimus]